MLSLRRSHIYTFFLIITITAFAHNGSISLWDQDEAAYAGFAKEMVNSGNWLIPEFMWSDIHRKTPLHFWNIALSYKIFGINEFSVRFPSTICILFTYLLVYVWGRKLFGGMVAFVSTIVLSTTLFVPILAKVSVTDATVLFLSTACALSVLQILRQVSIMPIIIFWVSFALALLTKGPPIIIFCSIFVGLLFLLHPNRTNLFAFHPWFFLPIAVVPLIIWGYWTMDSDNGTFIYWMIDWYILKRINGSVLGQSGPPGTHLLLIIAFFIPYLIFLPKAFLRGMNGIWKRDGENLSLGVWFVSGWLIYEFSPSKLPAYTVVAHIPLAILIGKGIVTYLKTNTRPKHWAIVLQFSILMILSLVLLIVAYYIDASDWLKWSFISLNLFIIVGGFITYRLLNSRDVFASILGVNLLFQFVLSVLIMPQIDVYKNSTKRVADFVANNAVDKSTVVLANQAGHPPSLPFYIGLSFNNLIEEDNFDRLLALYQQEEPYVFILNEKQRDQFISHYTKLEFQEISSYFTDRKGQSNYYVLMNKISKQGHE